MWKRPIRPLRFDGDLAYVPLTQGYEAVIDAEDAWLVEGWNWCVRKKAHCQYAVRMDYEEEKPKQVPLHYHLRAQRSGYVIDHINGDGLDNRRCNLRYATREENLANSPARKTSKSGIKGVSQMKNGRWRAVIRYRKKLYILGVFDTAEEAKAAYDAAAIRFHGRFARIT